MKYQSSLKISSVKLLKTAEIAEIPGVFERVRQSLHRRMHACIDADWRHFEQLLQIHIENTSNSVFFVHNHNVVLVSKFHLPLYP